MISVPCQYSATSSQCQCQWCVETRASASGVWRPQLVTVSPVSAMMLQLLLLAARSALVVPGTSLDAGEQGECHVSRVEVTCPV